MKEIVIVTGDWRWYKHHKRISNIAIYSDGFLIAERNYDSYIDRAILKNLGHLVKDLKIRGPIDNWPSHLNDLKGIYS